MMPKDHAVAGGAPRPRAANVAPVPPFRPLRQHELERLDDDALIAYMRQAARAGHGSARLALGMLVYGHREAVRRRVLLKVPPQDVEDLTDEISPRRSPPPSTGAPAASSAPG